jgi:hypothetical protein
MKLSNEDWTEIYYALDAKRQQVSGHRDPLQIEWASHLDALMEKIGPDGRNMWDLDKLAIAERIHAILDSPNEWDSETIEHVAEVLTDNGYVIRDPNDASLFSEREQETGVRD